jgi:hypothetical protein
MSGICSAHKEFVKGCRQCEAMTEKPCIWQEEDEYWQTGCGHAFCLNAGTPLENGMKFCAYCGKPIKEEVMGDE